MKTPAALQGWLWTAFLTLPSALDLRVSKGVGGLGYNALRVSVVSGASDGRLDPSFFPYDEPFQHRWTQMRVATALKSVDGPANFSINGTSVAVSVPKQGEGIRALMFGDPCNGHDDDLADFICMMDYKPDVRTPALLNAAAGEIDMWAIFGDNFYDQDGHKSKSFFDQLSLGLKSRILVTVPGNHDYWVDGAPGVSTKRDQYGNGFMQFYGQDAMVSERTNGQMWRNFSSNPDKKKHGKHLIAHPDNFFSYHMIGNVGWIGYSSAYAYGLYEQYFREACDYMGQQGAKAVYLISHWSENNDGAEDEMSTPSVFKRIETLPGCDTGRLRYITAHTHCNKVLEGGKGLMLGASGMDGGDECDKLYGIGYLDTRGGRQIVVMFPVQEEKHDNYDALLHCFQSKGPGGCLHLGNVWINETLPA